jgi:RNA polymerase sigma factor (sigma-70 family)
MNIMSQGSTGSGRSSEIQQALDRFEGPLIHYATRLLGGDVERARDVVQDTFLRLWQADAASVNGHLGQWLYRVCRNRALDVRRKENRMTTLQHEQELTSAHRNSRPADMESHPNDATHGVMNMLETLPDKQQEVLRLKFQGNLSYAEIANVMEITANHVGVLIHTALKSIRERLNTTTTTTPETSAVSRAGIAGSALPGTR